MVVMKGLTLPPLVMGSVRLLPAGALLVVWGALQGRPQPRTLTAWCWVAAFALVDGAAFQVRRHDLSVAQISCHVRFSKNVLLFMFPH
jgi:hypothetical protein